MPGLRRCTTRGADGEEGTAARLAALPNDQFTVFHDVRWPRRRYANFDHVVVGPDGVFVIDSKNWSGRIKVDETATTFVGPLAGAAV